MILFAFAESLTSPPSVGRDGPEIRLSPLCASIGQTEPMGIGRADRRIDRRGRVVAAMGESATEPALDLLELLELAWHDCYGEVTPPESVIDEVLVVSGGTLDGLIGAARLAVTDRRDLRLAAAQRRG